MKRIEIFVVEARRRRRRAIGVRRFCRRRRVDHFYDVAASGADEQNVEMMQAVERRHALEDDDLIEIVGASMDADGAAEYIRHRVGKQTKN